MKLNSDQLPAIILTPADAVVPVVIAARGPHAGRRFVEFFTANIRNPNTRKAYYRATSEFFDWCEQTGLGLLDIEPVHIAAWVESLGRGLAPPTVKQCLAAVRMLFDWQEGTSSIRGICANRYNPLLINQIWARES